LLNNHDKARWIHRLSKSQGVTNAALPFDWGQVRTAFVDWKTYVYSLMYIGAAQPFYSLALFTPTIIAALGYTNADANLMTVPPYVVGFITTLVTAYISDRVLYRGPFLIFWMMIVVIAYIILLTSTSIGAKYFAIFLAVAGASPSISLCITWIGNNVGPSYTRGAAMGFFFGMGNAAGLISSNVYPSNTGPRYIEGHAIAVAFSAMAVLCAVILYVANWRENARRTKAFGPAPEDGSDCSPLNVANEGILQKYGLEGMQPHEVLKLGDRHPAFRYVL